jgi:hypothetical protein
MIHHRAHSPAILAAGAAALLALPAFAAGPFDGFVNKGLVGVGRIPAASFDKLGHGVDTLGGVFSAMQFVPERPDRYRVGNTYHGTLFGLPDRGFGDGTQDFSPRYQQFRVSITPDFSGTPTMAQDQIKFTLQLTDRFEHGKRGQFFTGHDADPSFSLYPRSYPGGVVQQFLGVDVVSPASLGKGKWSLDAEGLVRAKDGTFWISDEYGPTIYHFDKTGFLIETLNTPEHILPKEGNTFGTRVRDFAASDLSISSITGRPESGRNDNRGLECLTITPDGRRLVSMLQSPAMQDSGSGGTQRNESINCRILYFDIEPGSVTYGNVVQEYVYQVVVPTVNNAATGGTDVEKRATAVSEILAINDKQFLVLDRDGYGRGQTESPRDTFVPAFKKVTLVDVTGATNLVGGPYAQERGANGALSLPYNATPVDNPATTGVNEGVVPATVVDFIDLLDPAQLAKFNLNVNSHAASDANTLCEKWEGLAIVPLNDPAAPNDYLILVGNDNDFKAPVVVHNGRTVGTNATPVDSMVLAYRVTLPTYQAPQ